MKKIFSTCLLTLVAVFGMAQTKTTFPITLTEAEGLPGPFLVQNYLFESDVYTLDAPVQKIRMTVCNTNTANNVGRGSHDGISAYDGTGQPFFTMSEVRFFDANGEAVDFVATGNSCDPGDGGGYAALRDKNEKTFLHTNYGGRCWSMPAEYHYVEFELEKEVSTFNFTIQTRTGYYKNLITYMGVTGGSLEATDEELQYLPYPEQNFQLGAKVTSVDALAESGAFFVMQGTAADYSYDYAFILDGESKVVTHTMPGNLYMRSPYEGCITPSAANIFYLIPDVDGLENTYRLRWLNSERYICNHKLSGNGNDIRTTWTRDINEAASLTFAPCDTAEGNFYITVPGMNGNGAEFTAYLGYDGYGRMDYIGDIDSTLFKTTRPHSYNWAIYNATINGSAIVARLQAAIDEAEDRIAKIGGKIKGQDEGEYDALMSALTVAKLMVKNPDIAAADVISATNNLHSLTIAYATVGLWAYADTINVIDEMVQNKDILVISVPEWQAGAYLQSAYDNLIAYIETLDAVTAKCESLDDVDKAIEDMYKVVSNFWASRISRDALIYDLPLRVGRSDEGLPGVNTNSIFRWESPYYHFTEEFNQIRLTVFKTKANRTLNGKPYVCLTELEFYDLSGKKIPMTGNSYSTPSVANEGGGLAGLCDGSTTIGTHFHSQWASDNDYDGSEFFYLDITFPETIAGFKYVQYARGNGYDDVPTDFAFSNYGKMITPDDVAFPSYEDPYGAVLGEQITDVSQITDEGFYAIVGNWNSAPEGSGSSRPILYTGANCYGALENGIGASCAFRITKTDNDSTFNIFSLAANCYLMNNGGPGAYYTALTYDIEKAAQVRIIPSTPTRKELGAKEFENAFFIYHYVDSIEKDVYVNGENIKKPCPYLFLDSWGGEGSGRFVWRSMSGIDEFASTDETGNMHYFMGELEWNIYRMTMDRPNQYWLQAIYDEASKQEMLVSNDPGYYSIASVGAFADALVQAQTALEAYDEAVALAAIEALQTTIHLPETAERNPVVEGIYVIEADNPNYFANQGVKKAICAYFNDFEKYYGELSTSSEYSLWWTNAPASYDDVDAIKNMFKFEFVPAVITEEAPEGSIYSEQLAIWYEDNVVTEKQLASAFFIKSVQTGQYVGVSETVDPNTGIPILSRDIGFTDEPLYPYIVREQGAYKFDIWCPVGSNNCLHQEDHGNGGGSAGDIVHWNGGSGVAASLWQLRKISAVDDGIMYSLAILGENGTYSGEGEYLYGTNVELTAVPNAGYKFVGWYKDGKLLSLDSNLLYRMCSNTLLYAKFEPLQAKNILLNVNNLTTFSGSELVIPVEMKNEEEVTVVQFDIYLPDGITIATDEDEELMITLSDSRMTSSHTLTATRQDDGAIRIHAYSGSNEPFCGNDGVLVNITTKVSDDMAVGEYTLTMKNIRLADTVKNEYVINEKSSNISVTLLRGDANKDLAVSISDVVTVVSHILSIPTKAFNFAAADVTGDGKISISDIVGIVNIILNPVAASDNGYNAKRGAVASNGDRLSISGVSCEGGNVSIPVSLENTTAYTAFQMDVELPEGATLASATLGSRAASSHSVTWSKISENKVRVLAYSIKNATFANGIGELVTFDVQAADGVNGTVAVDNVRMVTADGVETAIGGCGTTIDGNGTTGVNTIDSNMFKAYTANGALVIESGKDMQLSLYSANGRLLEVLDVVAGKNIFDALPVGVYVVNGVKIVIK